MSNWITEINAALTPLRAAGLSVGVEVSVHGCDAEKIPNARELMRLAQKMCQIPKLKHNVAGRVTWWNGAKDGIELTIFDYLGPHCRIEEYEETQKAVEEHVVEAQPERVVRRTRIVCDEPSLRME